MDFFVGFKHHFLYLFRKHSEYQRCSRGPERAKDFQIIGEIKNRNRIIVKLRNGLDFALGIGCDELARGRVRWLDDRQRPILVLLALHICVSMRTLAILRLCSGWENEHQEQ